MYDFYVILTMHTTINTSIMQSFNSVWLYSLTTKYNFHNHIDLSDLMMWLWKKVKVIHTDMNDLWLQLNRDYIIWKISLIATEKYSTYYQASHFQPDGQWSWCQKTRIIIIYMWFEGIASINVWIFIINFVYS